MNYPLHGMKILDFTYLLPGPYGSMMLADMGAKIIKVENFNNPDLMRITPPIQEGMSAVYAQVNRGKKSLALNLKSDEAKEIVYKLIGEYDIVLEQFRPGVMERLGLGYDVLKRVNSSIIYCSLTGYGQTGGYAGRAGHDINYLALSGIESFSGRKDSGPSPSGIQIADIAAGSKNLVIAVLTAYVKRLTTGKGDYADISMADGVFAMSVLQTAGYLSDGRIPAAESEMLNGGTAYDFYKTSDGRYVSVGPIEPKFFKNFLEATDLPELLNLQIFDKEAMDRAKLKIAEKISSKTMAEWHSIFKNTDACAEPVFNLQEAVNNQPISERDMIISVGDGSGKWFKQVASPIKFRSGNYHAEFAGVDIGHHNSEILRSLGFSDDDIGRFRESGVING